MNARLLVAFSALLLMGAPCASDETHDHECPPVTAADAGAVAPAPDAGEEVADAGSEAAPTEPIPSFGEQELGMLHNAAVLMIKEKLESGDITLGDNPATNITRLSNAVASWMCELGYNCVETQRVSGEVIKELNKVLLAIPEGGTLSQGLYTHLATMDDVPDWFVSDVQAVVDGFAPGDNAAEQARSAFADIGRGQGAHDGGNSGRIARGVGGGSVRFWLKYSEDSGDSDPRRDVVVASLDLGGAKVGAAVGGLVGCIVGAAAISAIAKWG
jgi:hypothetical protein